MDLGELRNRSLEEVADELRKIERQRGEIERSIREIESKERRKRPRKEEEKDLHQRKQKRLEDSRHSSYLRRDVQEVVEELDSPKVSSMVSLVSLPQPVLSKSIPKEDTNNNDNKSSQPETSPTTETPSSTISTPTATPPTARPTEERPRRRNNLFGKLLIGTLNQFKQDLGQKSDVLVRREEIQSRIESKVMAEKDVLEQDLEESRKLLDEQKEKEKSLRELMKQKEEERDLAEARGVWDDNVCLISNFFQTIAEPRICYLPAKHNDKTTLLLEEKRTKQELLASIRNSRTSQLQSSSSSSSPPLSTMNGTEDGESSSMSAFRDDREDSTITPTDQTSTNTNTSANHSPKEGEEDEDDDGQEEHE